jgi:hypothetical protein
VDKDQGNESISLEVLGLASGEVELEENPKIEKVMLKQISTVVESIEGSAELGDN